MALTQDPWSTMTHDPAEPPRLGHTRDAGHDFTSSSPPKKPAVVSKRRVTLAGSVSCVLIALKAKPSLKEVCKMKLKHFRVKSAGQK